MAGLNYLMPLGLHFLLARKIAKLCRLDQYNEWITETCGTTEYLTVIIEAIMLLMLQKKPRGSRRKSSVSTSTSKVDLEELTEIKFSVCRKFMMRLEADKVDVSFYKNQSLMRNIPLTTGIGSAEVDRNSIEDLELAKTLLSSAAAAYVAAIREVCEGIELPKNNFVNEPWPSHLYFEDVNGETQFELVELILKEVYRQPKFKKKLSWHS